MELMAVCRYFPPASIFVESYFLDSEIDHTLEEPPSRPVVGVFAHDGFVNERDKRASYSDEN